MDTPAAGDAASALLAEGTMSVDAAVKFTDLSRAELYRLMAGRRLAFVKHGGRRLLPKKALVEMLAAGLIGTTTTA